VIFRARHLQEDGLFECYLAEHCGEPLEPPAAEHLTDCADCRARYGDLRRFMDALRTDADSELDEIFPPERQRAQQHSIARRIEPLGYHARVISFPGRLPGQPTPSASSRVAHHWLGVAAAAGLAIGVGLGTAYYSQGPAPQLQTVASRSIVAPSETSVPAIAPALVNSINEQFLSELELALERPHTSELVALDELTPHVREVRVQLR
jgi:anti-sigma factor RsiW